MQVLYGETPCNPRLFVLDLEGLAALGQSVGAVTMVDSTFATPYLLKPIKLGIDIVVHAALVQLTYDQ